MTIDTKAYRAARAAGTQDEWDHGPDGGEVEARATNSPHTESDWVSVGMFEDIIDADLAVTAVNALVPLCDRVDELEATKALDDAAFNEQRMLLRAAEAQRDAYAEALNWIHNESNEDHVITVADEALEAGK